MEDIFSVLSQTHRYAAAGMLTVALHLSQIQQTRALDTSILRDEETSGGGASVGGSISVSDNPKLWIHENSGLIWPVFRLLGVHDQAWHGLKETAGSSSESEVRCQVEAFLKLLSEEGDGTSSERLDKERALREAVDATVVSMMSTPASSEGECGIHEKKTTDQENYNGTQLTSNVDSQPQETKHISIEKKVFGRESGTLEQPMEEAAILSHQRKVTVLYALLSACVADTNEIDKKCSPPRKGYDARHRVALRLMATWLGIKWIEMEAMEIMVAFSFMEPVRKEAAEGEDSKISGSNWDKWKRGGIIGATAITGGTLMAITGGLAAPAIAHGLGALAPTLGTIIPVVGASGFAAAATATGSVAGSVAVAASFGAAGASLTGSKMATRTGSLEEFELKEDGGDCQGRLAVGIFIAGLAFEMEDFLKPWKGLNDNLERYVLQWESKNLIALSTAVQDWLTSKIVMELMKDGAMLTVLSTLVTAMAWPATLLTTFDLIDSRWAVCLDRSDKAGKVLAEVLLKGLQGNRPVTLVGFSLGARIIFKCLQCLADSEGDNAGLVERVVILGAPIPISDENWKAARKMVAGRFVNVYSTSDWTLGVAFRASLLSQGLAGIQPVDLPGIENVDVTQLIVGHSSYQWMTKQILEQLELDNYYAAFRNGRIEPQVEKESVSEYYKGEDIWSTVQHQVKSNCDATSQRPFLEWMQKLKRLK